MGHTILMKLLNSLGQFQPQLINLPRLRQTPIDKRIKIERYKLLNNINIFSFLKKDDWTQMSKFDFGPFSDFVFNILNYIV